ncbi:hypothetical protein [Gaoshiqia sediminis]|uniref:Uncharacterized protein n=1 Tax=Gaoshiqia sediminis TaxID=2986998 RepID=A0AA42C7C4_9BACT|nr:hypothetical protein [Gaoshiqia sediminis]MCW0481441.1 hypothetical protein [Gaoshiqia sediminis]
MKKLMLMLAVFGFLAIGNVNPAFAQEEDLLLMEDTLSIDDMDPVFYEAEQEKSNNTTTIVIVVVSIVVGGGAAFFYMKKKK